MVDRDGQDRNFVASLGRGLAIIEVFGTERRPLLSTEISALLNLNRATTRRFLMTLTALGYVEQRGKLYSPTSKVLDLGYTYFASKSFIEIADPIVHDLSQRMQETASMTILDGSDVVYVCRSQVKRLISMNIDIGTRLPAYVTSTGKVLLAHLPKDTQHEIIDSISFVKFTPHTVANKKDLLEMLTHVRQRGYALSIQELGSNLISIAVPVWDNYGQVIAAIQVATFATDFADTDLQKRFLLPLLEAAEKIQKSLVSKVKLTNRQDTLTTHMPS